MKPLKSARILFVFSFVIAVSNLLLENTDCAAQNSKPLPEITTESKADKNKRINEYIESKRKIPANVQTTHKIPTNFPIPVYSTNIISSSFTNSTKGIPTAVLTLTSKDDPKTIFEWYKTQCGATGWKVKTPKTAVMSARQKKGDLYVLNAQNGAQQCTVSCSRNAKLPRTLVNVLWVKQSI